MRILFLTQGTHTPSSRFRVGQFVPHFQKAGIECTIAAGYGAGYNRIVKTKWGTPYKAAMQMKRFLFGLSAPAYDLLFLQRPILPFTPWPEEILHRLNPRMLFDVDDAIFTGVHGEIVPARRHTFERCAALSAHVIAGNRFLSEAAGQPTKTTVLPTVIDTDRYRPKRTPTTEESSVVIGWIGSSSTLRYVEQILPALRCVRDRYPHVRIRIVCSEMPASMQHEDRFEFHTWSKEGEIAALQSFDIGIMPLEDSLTTRGKCGFKMIQYMAVGIPVVSSPVGANIDIFNGSHAGMLADSHDAWVHALCTLVADHGLRQDCGHAARLHATNHYAVHSVLPRYLDLFERMTGKPVI